MANELQKALNEIKRQREEYYQRTGTQMKFCAGTPEHSQSWNYTADPSLDCTAKQWVG